MPARCQLAAQRDRGKGVSGVAEGGEEDPPPIQAQSISARSRTVCLRRSGSNSIGDTISVPTPASR
jgi:hypothetical protein